MIDFTILFTVSAISALFRFFCGTLKCKWILYSPNNCLPKYQILHIAEEVESDLLLSPFGIYSIRDNQRIFQYLNLCRILLHLIYYPFLRMRKHR